MEAISQIKLKIGLVDKTSQTNLDLGLTTKPCKEIEIAYIIKIARSVQYIGQGKSQANRI